MKKKKKITKKAQTKKVVKKIKRSPKKINKKPRPTKSKPSKQSLPAAVVVLHDPPKRARGRPKGTGLKNKPEGTEKKSNVYFTHDTEEAIVAYNETLDPKEKWITTQSWASARILLHRKSRKLTSDWRFCTIRIKLGMTPIACKLS